jgi:hypothetical protein
MRRAFLSAALLASVSAQAEPLKPAWSLDGIFSAVALSPDGSRIAVIDASAGSATVEAALHPECLCPVVKLFSVGTTQPIFSFDLCKAFGKGPLGDEGAMVPRASGRQLVFSADGHYVAAVVHVDLQKDIEDENGREKTLTLVFDQRGKKVAQAERGPFCVDGEGQIIEVRGDGEDAREITVKLPSLWRGKKPAKSCSKAGAVTKSASGVTVADAEIPLPFPRLPNGSRAATMGDYETPSDSEDLRGTGDATPDGRIVLLRFIENAGAADGLDNLQPNQWGRAYVQGVRAAGDTERFVDAFAISDGRGRYLGRLHLPGNYGNLTIDQDDRRLALVECAGNCAAANELRVFDLPRESSGSPSVASAANGPQTRPEQSESRASDLSSRNSPGSTRTQAIAEGHPQGEREGAQAGWGYRVWHDAGGWHLRITPDQNECSGEDCFDHLFSGWIDSPTGISGVTPVALGSPPLPLSASSRQIQFSISLQRGEWEKGFDWQQQGPCATFSLLQDVRNVGEGGLHGTQLPTGVAVGGEAWHPPSGAPFQVCGNPSINPSDSQVARPPASPDNQRGGL